VPLTELGIPQIPTSSSLASVAAEQGPDGVRQWLMALEVSPEAAERVAEAMEAALRATPEGADAAQQAVRQHLQAAYAEFMDPDSVRHLMSFYDDLQLQPVLNLARGPDPRLYPERELAGLGRADLDELERVRQSVASGDDTWLGRAADDPNMTPPMSRAVEAGDVDAQVNAYLERVRGFRPTLERQYPGGGAGLSPDGWNEAGRLDLAAVLTGDKPGALIAPNGDPVVERMLALAQEQGLAAAPVNTRAGGELIVANTPEAATELAQLFSGELDEAAHTRIAELLGYTPDAAIDFLMRSNLFQAAREAGFDAATAQRERWPRMMVEQHLRHDLCLNLDEAELDSMLRYWGP